MKLLRAALGLIPFVGILGGVFFVNRIEPMVLGLPFLFFWIVAWTVATVLIMALVYCLDPRDRNDANLYPGPPPQGEKRHEERD